MAHPQLIKNLNLDKNLSNFFELPHVREVVREANKIYIYPAIQPN
jgi:hypothetical protein